MIRRGLDALYTLSGYIAALFLVGIAVTIVIQLICRLFSVPFDGTEVAGFSLAATTFFGLAYTFRHGGHVRITLTIERFPQGIRRVIELINCVIASAGIIFLAWHFVIFTWQSYQYHDISPGLMAMPFWIPQSIVSVGIVLLAVALLDELQWIARGRPPHYDVDELSSITQPE